MPIIGADNGRGKENVDPESGSKPVSAETSFSMHQIRDDEFADLDELFSRPNSQQSLQGLQNAPVFEDLVLDAEVHLLNCLKTSPEDLDNPSLRDRLAECLTNEWLRDRQYAEDQARYSFGDDYDTIGFNPDPESAKQG